MFKPKKLKDFVGNKEAVLTLLGAVKTWTTKSRSIAIFGPPGVGKNLLVELIAKELNYELYEINASDCRDAESLKKTVGETLKQASWKNGKIVLIDEVDAALRKDRNLVATVLAITKKSPFPVILTANSLEKLPSLKRSCNVIEMKPVSHEEIFNLYKKLSKGRYNENLLRSLARRSGGDVRSALMDFQVLTSEGKIEKKDLEFLDSRDRTNTIENCLKIIFKTNDAKIARTSIDSVDLRPEEILWWLEENIPLEYDGKGLAKAFDCLSRADIVSRRIKKNQSWSLLKYYFDLLSSCVALSKEKVSTGVCKYRKPNRGFFFGRLKYKNAELNEIAEEFAPKLHCSKQAFKRNYGFLVRVLSNRSQN